MNKIPRFQERRCEDYVLWHLHLRAAFRVKVVYSILETGSFSSNAATTRTETTITDSDRLSTKLEKASGMIISALGNYSLRVVTVANEDPARMQEILNARYVSMHTVSRISVQGQLLRMRYSGQNIYNLIDEYTDLFSQLEFMGKEMLIQEAHKAPMLLAPIDSTSELEPIATALQTKNASEFTWEYVATTLINE